MKRKSLIFRLAGIIFIVLPLLGCISMSYFVDMDADASGKGTIYHTVTVPDTGGSGGSIFDSYIKKLTDEGWEDIEFSSPGNDQIQLSATYRIDAEAGHGFPDSMKNMKITVEEAENGSRYFTFDGKYDYTQLQQSWTNFKNQKDKDFSYDLGEWFGGEKVLITKEEIDEYIQRYGDPKIEFKLRLPGNTPVETKGPWKNGNDYMNGKTDTIEFLWTPDKKATGTLYASRRWEPGREAQPEDMASNLQALTTRYMQEIPTGVAINILEMPTGGWFNNIFFAHIIGEIRTCGAYQNYVMDFLDGIRTSSDPEVRGMLNGYDYGPIQTNGGGHVAVVVFPSGTDWTETGTVFDPWPTQRAQAYDISTWFLALGPYAYGGYYPEPSYGSENLYPQLSGKPPSYPAQSDLNRKSAQPVRQILVINSPVTVMVELADGRQAGVMPTKAGMNQAPQDISFYTLSKDNGEHSWFFFLPGEAAEVTVYGQKEGSVHIGLITEDEIMTYGSQHIYEAEAVTFSIDKNLNPGTLKFESGATAKPTRVSAEEFAEKMGASASEVKIEENEPQVKPTRSTYDGSSYSGGGTGWVGTLCLGLCCCLIVLLLVAVVILVVTLTRKKRQNVPLPPPTAPPLKYPPPQQPPASG